MRRHIDAVRTEPEVAGTPVQQVAEATGAVEPWGAQPTDGAVRCYQRAGVAIGDKRILRDRWKRRTRHFRHTGLLDAGPAAAQCRPTATIRGCARSTAGA